MWEDSILPDAWNACLNTVNAILAPSRFCVRLFEERVSELGMKTPVHYVPLGVNHDLYPYRQRTFHRGNEPFVVLHCSTAVDEERKGGMIAYEAFLRAFGDSPDVRLVFRCRQGKLPISDSRVIFDSGVATDEEKLQQMYAAHVLLYPSYGEGFGLIPLEAIASGLPAIVSDNTGMADYRDLFEPIQCDPETSGIAVYFQRESRGDWMRPRIEDAANNLRWMRDNYQATHSRSAKTAKAVRAQWGYDRSARAILDILEG
jgi:glycosyltransferase involved in cell wall biosynthesis